ncbi:MAG: C25 family cysteine peptidase [Planctomycetota bacterium]
MNRISGKNVCATTAVSMVAAMTVLVVSLSCWCASASAADDGETESIAVAIPVGNYEIISTRQGQEVSVDGYGSLLVPGKPKLPSKILAIAIPPGAVFEGVDYDLGKGVILSGTYEILPAPLPRVIGQEDPVLRERDLQRYERNFKQAYESDDAYPASAVEFVRTAGYRRYNLVDVRVTPVQYHPVSGRLVYYPDISVDVRYRLSGQPGSAMVDSLPRTERVAEEIILNHEQASAWYAAPRGGDRGLHDFVIITLDSLTSSVTSLVNSETAKGRNVQVVTTSWINTNYPGGYDLAERMRNFLRDKYPSGEWGIEDVLLVGGYDDVPMRRTAQDVGYGQPETDFYYAELSLPDDQSWDDDEDHQYGENSDPIDFYSEVNVGRIPWSTSATVQSICAKSVAYEQNTDPAFKKNILLLGSFFWSDTDNAELMEAKVDQPWMSDWTMTRLYEQNSTVYSTFPCDYEISHANVMSVWTSGQFAFVNWAGHGSPTSTHMMGYSSQAFIQSSDCSSLNDNYPAIIFADACSNSDTDYTNLGQSMLQRGAVGFVGATKVALGCPGWNDSLDGSSQSMDYYFTTSVTSGQYSQGEAHQRALREMYSNGLWDYNKYETFEWGALWGNPALRMFDATGLKVSPNYDLASEGPLGGPFTPDSIVYTVENLGPGSINYNVTKSESWITITNGAGTLPNVGDTANVTVSINASADSLPNGSHEDTINFINTTDHKGDATRRVLLDIGNNDDCADAFVACPGVYTGNTNSASNDGSASCGTSSSSADVWYSYTPDSGGSATFSLCTGTTYDAVLSVHSGCPGTSSNELGCDDDYCGGGGPSQVSIPVTGGNTYLIRVTGWNGSTGSHTLTLTGPDCAQTCQDGYGNMDGLGGVNGNDIIGFVDCYLGGDPGAPGCGCADMYPSTPNGQFEQEDVEAFVDCLLGDCPA